MLFLPDLLRAGFDVKQLSNTQVGVQIYCALGYQLFQNPCCIAAHVASVCVYMFHDGFIHLPYKCADTGLPALDVLEPSIWRHAASTETRHLEEMAPNQCCHAAETEFVRKRFSRKVFRACS